MRLLKMKQVILLVGCVVMCQGLVWAVPPTNYEGFGANTTGALAAPGGYTTYHVTKLTDDGSAGTFRDAISEGSRLIVFDVGGTITLASHLVIRDSYITIDGSTAPSPGITIVQPTPIITAIAPYEDTPITEIIIKYIRMDGQSVWHEPGDIWTLATVGTNTGISNVVLDHITAIASPDGVFDMVWDVNHVTISNCFLFDTMMTTIVNGGTTTGQACDRISMHHNVFARSDGRCPLLQREVTNFDFVNNVVYGWGYFGAGEQGIYILYEAGLNNPDGEFTKNNYHFVITEFGDEDAAILLQYYGDGADRGNITFTDNIFPDGETDDVSYGTPTVIPEEYKPTEYDANTLGDTVVPFVGTHYPTQEEQDLLDEISLAIGGQGYVLDPNNPPPVLQAIGDNSVDENVTLTFTVNATDPNGEPITYSAQSLPSGATLDPQTGDFAWTPSYTQAGSYQVRFIASDGNSQDSETITITVNNVNRAPVLGTIGNQSVNENVLLSFSVNATDADGQTLTYSVSGLPSGAVFAGQTFTWTPSYDQAGTYPVTFTANDGQAQDSQEITITVNNVNRTPVLAAINNQSVWSDDPLTFTIDATDPDGDTVTYSAGTLPSGATFTGQDFDWTPSQGQMGSYAVTFLASDGQAQDSQMVTITVNVDSLAPTVTNSLPTAGSIQAPLNNLINLNITDAGKGVNADSVTIKVNNNTVYTGDTNHYTSPDGECRRLGNKTDYRFVYQSNEEFDYDQTMGITVTATDLAGNVMSEHSYSFVTEMRSFGQNKQVNSGPVNLNNDRPVTVRDSSGNIWAAWHAGSIGNRDIYIGKLTAGADYFGSTVQLTDNTADQCNPAVALDSNDKLYVVWQDNREGDWDIYVSTSVDGISWSTEIRVNDPNIGNQINPAIVIDGQSPNQAHVVWQDDRAGNQDICIATSSDGFVTTMVSQITSNSFDQVEPDITADSANTIYVVWTDGRNSSNDIYGAASNNSWINVQIVNNANNQSCPAIAAESAGSILHLLWVDDTFGDNDIYYASSNGLLDCPLTGSSIIDDTSAADQLEPAIVIEGSTVNNLKVFACWQDWRNADTDLYFAELSAGSGTNVFVGDGGSSAYQGEPAIGIDEYDHPYLVWSDSRNTDIYYAGSTFVEPVPIISVLAPFSKGAVYGLPVGQLSSSGDICLQVPPGAYSHEIRLKTSRIKNAQRFSAKQSKVPYEFGPSGIDFNVPITITIAYTPVDSPVSVYWHDPLTGTLKQDGITNVTIIEKSPTLHLVRFKVRHFTAFYLIGGGAAAAIAGGGGGGGCSVSASGEGDIVEFLLPYIGFVVVLAILKMRDARYRKARNMTTGKC